MQERTNINIKPEWRTVNVGNGCRIQEREINPKIQAQMPISGRTFMQVGPIESLVREVKKLLKGEPNDLFS